MEQVKITTTTYCTKYPGFYVDINACIKSYSAWLYHEEYDVKMYMFGILKKDGTKHDMIDITETLLENYINNYKKEYMDE